MYNCKVCPITKGESLINDYNFHWNFSVRTWHRSHLNYAQTRECLLHYLNSQFEMVLFPRNNVCHVFGSTLIILGCSAQISPSLPFPSITPSGLGSHIPVHCTLVQIIYDLGESKKTRKKHWSYNTCNPFNITFLTLYNFPAAIKLRDDRHIF
jgi:hypothetical protein